MRLDARVLYLHVTHRRYMDKGLSELQALVGHDRIGETSIDARSA